MQVSPQLVNLSQKVQRILVARFSKYSVLGAILALTMMTMLVLHLAGDIHAPAVVASHTATHSISQVVDITPADVTPSGKPWPNP